MKRLWSWWTFNAKAGLEVLSGSPGDECRSNLLPGHSVKEVKGVFQPRDSSEYSGRHYLLSLGVAVKNTSSCIEVCLAFLHGSALAQSKICSQVPLPPDICLTRILLS